MKKLAARAINSKNLKKSCTCISVCFYILQNLFTDFNETLFVASGTPASYSLYVSRPWVDLDLFYSKVKFGHIVFSFEKELKYWIFFRPLCDLPGSGLNASLGVSRC